MDKLEFWKGAFCGLATGIIITFTALIIAGNVMGVH